jgi:hypothetical protein
MAIDLVPGNKLKSEGFDEIVTIRDSIFSSKDMLKIAMVGESGTHYTWHVPADYKVTLL